MIRTAAALLLVLCPTLLAADVHVSVAGDDGNPGTKAAPLRTVAAGIKKLRDGDRLLLRRGDTWRDWFGVWTRSDIVITAYGEGPRPKLDPGDRHGMDAMADTAGNVALVGIALVAESRSPDANPAGIRWLAGDNLLIEDCLIEGFATNVIVMSCKNVTIRDSVIRNAYPVPDRRNGVAPHSQGIYAGGVIGLTIERNVIDRNGWRPGDQGGEPTWFNHDIYVSAGSADIVIRNNVISRACGFGIKCMVAATIEDNLLYRCPLGFSVGYRRQPVGEYQPAFIRNNVLLESPDIQRRKGGPIMRGNGLGINHLKKVVVTGNIFGPPATAGDVSTGISLQGTTASPKTGGLAGLEDVEFKDNIVYGYDVGLALSGDTFGNVRITDNVINGRADCTGRQPRPLASVAVAPEILGRFVFQGNAYSHATGHYAGLGRGSRLSFAEWVALTGERGAVELRVPYSNPDITPHEAVGLESFDDLIEAAAEGRLTVKQINAAVRQKGFTVVTPEL